MTEAPQIAILALGANLGNRVETLHAAIDEIASLPGIAVNWVSPLVESVALTLSGTDESAPKYINCVVQARVSVEPLQLLHQLQAIELAHGRVREQRWASRTLDIDIVQFGGLRLSTDELTVPHPEASNRNFVLWPWLLADPNAELLGFGRIAELPHCTKDQLSVLQVAPEAPTVKS